MKNLFTTRQSDVSLFIYLETEGEQDVYINEDQEKTITREELIQSIKEKIESILEPLTPQEKIRVHNEGLITSKAEARKTNEGAREEILSLLDILTTKARSIKPGHEPVFLTNLKEIKEILHTSSMDMPLVLEEIAEKWHMMHPFYNGHDLFDKKEKLTGEHLLEEFEQYIAKLSEEKQLSFIKKSESIYWMFEKTIRDAAREEVAQKNGK